MDVSSAQHLCEYLISTAIQRCRKSDNFCRLSVVLRSSCPLSGHHLVQISVSDTGVGSCLEEFQCLKYTINPASDEHWDGSISLTTTCVSDDEIFHYQLNLTEIVPSRKLVKLPSSTKNGTKFSGTEAGFSVSGIVDGLISKVTNFLQKILILRMHNIAIELMVQSADIAGSQCENFVLANESTSLPHAASNIERLKSGLEDYVFRHGNNLKYKCPSCFTERVHLKIGSGVAHRAESRKSMGQQMEAVIIISELPEQSASSCVRSYDRKTQVLYFQDFSPCSISESCLNGLTSTDWKSYGLTLKSIGDEDGYAILEWENLPEYAHIDILLHCYTKKLPMLSATRKTHLARSLTRKAVKLALDDLKEKNSGSLLSAHALKISKYAPDIASTVTGLILCSNDIQFQQECLSLLGLPPLETTEGAIVEDSIKRKILSAIEMNDLKPEKLREAAAPYLFEDDGYFQEEPDVLNEEYEQGFGSLDI